MPKNLCLGKKTATPINVKVKGCKVAKGTKELFAERLRIRERM